MNRRLLPLLLFAGACSSALASDDNIYLTNLYDENNTDYYWNVKSSEDRQDLFTALTRDLGIAISHKNLIPGETLGIYGFEVGLDTTIAFVTTADMCDVDAAIATCQYQEDRKDPWRVMDADHRLTFGNALLLPSLRIRKGLPFSTEAGLDLTYFSFSHQGALSGYFRGALHEGMWDQTWRIIPDVAFTIASTKFIGNEEFDLSILEWNLTLGWTVPVGGIKDSHVGTLSPFLGFGWMFITAVPFADTSDVDNVSDRLLALEGVTGRTSKTNTGETGDRPVVLDPSFSPLKLSIGMRIASGRFRLIHGLEVTYDANEGGFDPPTVSVGMGFIY